jgi:hypothetical protein
MPPNGQAARTDPLEVVDERRDGRGVARVVDVPADDRRAGVALDVLADPCRLDHGVQDLQLGRLDGCCGWWLREQPGPVGVSAGGLDDRQELEVVPVPRAPEVVALDRLAGADGDEQAVLAGGENLGRGVTGVEEPGRVAVGGEEPAAHLVVVA